MENILKFEPKKFTAKSVEEALIKVTKELNVSIKEIDYKVIQEPKKGFLGLGSKPAIIEVKLNNNFLLRKIREFLEEILKYFEGKFSMEYKFDESHLKIYLDGEGLGRLIGKYGKTLGAIQHIISIFVNRMTNKKVEVILDIGKYKNNRKKKIHEIVDKAAQTAIKEKRNVELAPMFAFERRMVHEYVKIKYPKLTTESVGVEPYRKVIIKFVKVGEDDDENGIKTLSGGKVHDSC